MKTRHSFLSLLLSFLIAAAMIPYCDEAAYADSVASYVLNGNSGAAVTLSTSVSSVSVDDSSLADVSASGNTVTVSGKDGAVGIATVTVNGSESFEVPVGYTTFIFNDNTLTVYEGSDTKYEVYGQTTADTEEHEMTAVSNDDGSVTYSNDGDIKLNVNIKKKGGSYVFSGTGSDMSISVNKAAEADANIILAGLDLTSSYTAPITVKKESTANVIINALEGTSNTLTDSGFNNADTYGYTEDGGNGTNAEYAESAVIKCKSYANVTLKGKGTLNLKCNSKNALKVGEYGSLTIEELTLNAVSAKHGISSDNTLTINSGSVNVVASEGDGIRSDPDTVNADSGAAGNIIVNGGVISVQAASDAIQAAQDITITGGTFNIMTGSGYSDSSFNKNTMSCKGIKASGNDDDESADAANTITITGGSFNLNTADDAVHSDGYIVITGGRFEILTGDDGVHADTSLTLGEENGSSGSVVIKVDNSYEGLEAGNIYVYSGTYNVTASDDGINAAGGSGSGDNFNPGGGPGGRNQNGGFNRSGFPGGNFGNPGNPGDWNTGNGGNGGNGGGDYSINIYGGNVYVNAEGDGLDSNGNINLEGGNIIVWGQEAGRDNSPLDCDGTLLINGATVFAAGGNSMNDGTPSSSSQKYITSTTNFTSGTIINVTDGSSVVYSTTAIKRANYVLYSSPSTTSSYKITNENNNPSEKTYIMGDADGDGIVTSADSLFVLRAIVGLEETNETIEKIADVDGDGDVTSNDSLDILRYCVGLNVSGNIGSEIEL